MDPLSNLQFTDDQVAKINIVASQENKQGMGSEWDDDKPKVDFPKEPKLLNGRYKKIKKLGQGSYNVVYLAEDLLPEGKNRILSQKHLDMIGKIPDKIINPYR